MTGVSRPEQVPVLTTSDGVAQPVVYVDSDGEPVPAPTTTLKTRVPAVAEKTAPERQASSTVSGAHINANGEIVTASSAYVPYRPAGASSIAETVEVERLTPAVAAADLDSGVVVRVPGPANQLPLGTMLKVRMRDELSTIKTASGTAFSAELTEAVERDGRVLLPVGSLLTGKVTDVHGGRRISGSATIHLVPMSVTLPDGMRYALRAQVIDTALYRSTKVDTEGTIVRRDHPKETVAVFALATGSGAAAGGVIAGVPGALVGGAVGAGVSTAMWLKKDRQTDLPAGTKVVFALTGPLVIGQ